VSYFQEPLLEIIVVKFTNQWNTPEIWRTN